MIDLGIKGDTNFYHGDWLKDRKSWKNPVNGGRLKDRIEYKFLSRR